MAWDVTNWSRALHYWDREGDLVNGALDCLEVGAKAGGLSVWLAQRGHHVVCSDLHNAHENANSLVQRYGVRDAVRFEDIDATAIPYERAFDIVIFKSVLGGVGRGDAIDRQRAAIVSMHRALRQGGRLFFAENLSGSPLHRMLRERYVAWGSSWRYVTIEEMQALLQPFARAHYETAGFFGTFGRSEVQRRALSLLDQIAMNALVPPSWRYIIYGIATK
jgi:SAM-dependent methyltransferase